MNELGIFWYAGKPYLNIPTFKMFWIYICRIWHIFLSALLTPTSYCLIRQFGFVVIFTLLKCCARDEDFYGFSPGVQGPPLSPLTILPELQPDFEDELYLGGNKSIKQNKPQHHTSFVPDLIFITTQNVSWQRQPSTLDHHTLSPPTTLAAAGWVVKWTFFRLERNVLGLSPVTILPADEWVVGRAFHCNALVKTKI